MTSALQVASLYASIELRDSLTSGLRTASTNLAGFGRNLRDVGTNLRMLTAPLLDFGVQGIKVASDFESAMAEITARTGLTGDALESVRQTALKLGADTVFSAQDAADAFLNLLASGQSSSEALATLPAVMDAAAASGEDLGKSADTVTNILASWQLPAENAADIVDHLARGAAASKASMTSLGKGFSSLGPVAREFGLSVEDTVAILAIFEQNGLKGVKAGTQLRSMLTNMNRPTKQTIETWQKLGFSLFDATGKARPLTEVMNDLRVATDGMSDQQRTSLLYQLAGSWGQMGLAALTSTISIDQMKKSMADSASIQDVVTAKTGTFAFAMESLKGSVEAFQINALTPLMNEGLRPLVEQMTQAVNAASVWVQANPELAASIVEVTAAIVGTGGLVLGLGQVVVAIGNIGKAISFLLSPAALLVGAIVLIGGAAIHHFGGIDKLLIEAASSADMLVKIIGAGLGFALSWVRDRAIELGNILTPVLQTARDIINTIPYLPQGNTPSDLATGFLNNAKSKGMYPFGDLNNAIGGSGGRGIQMRDNGGAIKANEIFGSGVPELFIPHSSGMAVPLSQMGGGRNITIYANFGKIATPDDVEQGKRAMMEAVIEAESRSAQQVKGR